MRVRILAVPYDSGHRSSRMGSGPEWLLGHGLVEALRSGGHEVATEVFEAQRPFTTEVGTAIELDRQLAVRVRDATEQGAFPLVLSGNCNSCLGTLAGIGIEHTAIAWLDAHADFNTPETTVSGFFDGMGLAAAAGRCWTRLTATMLAFHPIPESHIVLLGARDLDTEERALLASSAVTHVSADAVRADGMRQALAPALAGLPLAVRRIYLHLDLDVLDPTLAQANQFPAPGGLTVDDVVEAVRLLWARAPIAAGALTAYDPDYDRDGAVLRAALCLAQTLVETAAGGGLVRPAPVGSASKKGQ